MIEPYNAAGRSIRMKRRIRHSIVSLSGSSLPERDHYAANIGDNST